MAAEGVVDLTYILEQRSAKKGLNSDFIQLLSTEQDRLPWLNTIHLGNKDGTMDIIDTLIQRLGELMHPRESVKG